MCDYESTNKLITQITELPHSAKYAGFPPHDAADHNFKFTNEECLDVNNQLFVEYTSDKKIYRLYKLLSIKGNQIKLYFDPVLGKYFTIEYYPIVGGIQ